MKKRILIDLNHAFDVLFFKNLYFHLIQEGHEVLVVVSKKPHSYELLEEFEIPHIKIGSYGSNIISKAVMLFLLDFKMLILTMKFKPHLMLGHVSFRTAHVGWMLKIPNFIFTDTEHATEQISLFRPFAKNIITPRIFYSDLGKKQRRLNTIFELAYLHPDNFTPDPSILDELNLSKKDTFFIVRFISWDATHDKNYDGLSLSDKESLIEFLDQKGKVFISSERPLEKRFEPYRFNLPTSKIHHAMAFSTAYIGEGGTMASESALLGVPGIYMNPLKLGYIDYLESYNLIFKTNSVDRAIDIVQNEILDRNSFFKEQRSKLLNELEEPNKLIKSIIQL